MARIESLFRKYWVNPELLRMEEEQKERLRQKKECSEIVEKAYQSFEFAFRRGKLNTRFTFHVGYLEDQVIKCAQDVLIKDHVKLEIVEDPNVDRRFAADFTAVYLKK